MYVYVCKHMNMYEYAIICMNIPSHTSYASLFQCLLAGFKTMRALNLEVGWWWAWFLSSTIRKLSELGGQRMGQRALPAGGFVSHTKCAKLSSITVQQNPNSSGEALLRLETSSCSFSAQNLLSMVFHCHTCWKNCLLFQEVTPSPFHEACMAAAMLRTMFTGIYASDQ